MILFTATFVLFAILIGGFAWLYLPEQGLRRVAAPILLAAVLAGAYWLESRVMGLPAPEQIVGQPQGRLLAWTMEPGQAIYVWVEPETTGRPISLQLPWSEETQKALQRARGVRMRAMREGENSRLRFFWQNDEPMVRSAKRREPPDKTPEGL